MNSVKTTPNVQKFNQNQINLGSKMSSMNNNSSNLNSNKAGPSQPLNKP
ncbi:unnamed protein product, partial [Brachionus calyciflorus]